jgi:hypothetical protein
MKLYGNFSWGSLVSLSSKMFDFNSACIWWRLLKTTCRAHYNIYLHLYSYKEFMIIITEINGRKTSRPLPWYRKKSLKIPKGVIRIRISKRNRQHNTLMMAYQRTTYKEKSTRTIRNSLSFWFLLSDCKSFDFMLKKSLKTPRGNQNPYIEEGQTTQCPKENGQTEKTTIYKTLHIKLKLEIKLKYFRKWR